MKTVVGLVLFAVSLASAQQPIKVKTELQTCKEDLAMYTKMSDELYTIVKATPSDVTDLQTKYDDLVRRFNENVEKHNKLVDNYVELSKQYDQLYDVAVKVVSTPGVGAAPRSRVSAFMRGFSQSMAAQRQAKTEPVTCNTVSFGATSSTNCY